MSQTCSTSSFTDLSSSNSGLKSNKISGSARVTRVCSKFAYIISEKYGSIFVLPNTFVQDDSENENKTIDLSQVLRVDEVVHFAAIPQNGPNNCHWIAVKIQKSANFIEREETQISLPNVDEPEIIENVRGTVTEVYEKFGFIWSEKYGRIYLPLNACFVNVEVGASEFQKLSDCFLTGDIVTFTAERQPEVNGCRYAAVSGKLFVEETIDVFSEAGNAMLQMKTGQIFKLFPQFGYIKCEKLGNVFFTISNYVCSPDEQLPPVSLFDVLAEGTFVHFLPTPQPNKNDCVWRAYHVQKPSNFNGAGDFEDLVEYLQLDQDDCSNTVMEVSCQTDQLLWNTFLASQLPRRSQLGTNSVQKKPVADVACQTINPPEMMLLKAIKTHDLFRQELKSKFPDLMKYVEKMAL